MNRRAVINALILAANVVIGVWVIASLYARLELRRSEVDAVRAAAQEERIATQELTRQVSVQEAILGGLREDDPYVVEMLARDMGLIDTSNESSPPPLPEQ